MEKKTKTKTKSKTKEVEDIHFEDDRKIISRAKYMRNARRVLTGKKDYEVTVTKKDDIRKTKDANCEKTEERRVEKKLFPCQTIITFRKKDIPTEG